MTTAVLPSTKLMETLCSGHITVESQYHGVFSPNFHQGEELNLLSILKLST